MSTLEARHHHHTGAEWAWTPIPRSWTPGNAITALRIRRRFIDGRLWFLFLKKGCTVLMTSHITWHCTTWFVTSSVQCTLFFHQYSAPAKLVAQCAHYTAPLLLHCIVLTPLQCTHYTALTTTTPLHCTVLTSLQCAHYTAQLLLHCTVLTTLQCAHYTALTTTTPLHCMLWSWFN